MIEKIQRYCQELSPSQRKRLVLLAFAGYSLLTLFVLWFSYKEYHQGEAPAIQHIDNQALVPGKGKVQEKDSLTLKQLNNGKEHTPTRAKQ